MKVEQGEEGYTFTWTAVIAAVEDYEISPKLIVLDMCDNSSRM